MLINSFGMKVMVHEKVVMVDQTVTVYGDCVKMCEDFNPKLGLSPPTHPTFLCFPDLKATVLTQLR
jgi:hypothetical protein